MVTHLNQATITLQEIRATQVEAYEFVRKLPRNRVLQLMALLNSFAYSMSLRYGAIVKVGETYQTSTSKIKEMAAACKAGLGEMSAAVLWLSNHLKKNWTGACHGPESIRKMREHMRDKLGLFTFEPRPEGSADGPPEMLNVDVPKMLMIYELCERVYLERAEVKSAECSEASPAATGDISFDIMTPGETNLGALPKHRGSMMVTLYNAMFDGIARYHRDDRPDGVNETETIELPTEVDVPEKKPVKLVWRKYWRVPEKIWNAMVRKAQNIDWDWLGNWDIQESAGMMEVVGVMRAIALYDS